MMRDVMENAGLSIFPQIGIFLFLTGFALAWAYAFIFVRSERAEALARMPLDD
jgi:hypothetical protein